MSRGKSDAGTASVFHRPHKSSLPDVDRRRGKYGHETRTYALARPTSGGEIRIKAMRSMGTVLWGTAEYPSRAFGSSAGFEAASARTT